MWNWGSQCLWIYHKILVEISVLTLKSPVVREWVINKGWRNILALAMTTVLWPDPDHGPRNQKRSSRREEDEGRKSVTSPCPRCIRWVVWFLFIGWVVWWSVGEWLFGQVIRWEGFEQVTSDMFQMICHSLSLSMSPEYILPFSLPTSKPFAKLQSVEVWEVILIWKVRSMKRWSAAAGPNYLSFSLSRQDPFSLFNFPRTFWEIGTFCHIVWVIRCWVTGDKLEPLCSRWFVTLSSSLSPEDPSNHFVSPTIQLSTDFLKLAFGLVHLYFQPSNFLLISIVVMLNWTNLYLAFQKFKKLLSERVLTNWLWSGWPLIDCDL